MKSSDVFVIIKKKERKIIHKTHKIQKEKLWHRKNSIFPTLNCNTANRENSIYQRITEMKSL